MKAAWILGMAAGAAVLLVVFLMRETAPPSPAQTRLFPEFQAEDVSGIRISGPDGGVQLSLGEKGWQVDERDGYPADSQLALTLVRKIWELRPTQVQKLPPGDAARFQLLPRQGEGAPDEVATQVEFFDASGNNLACLWLGKRQIQRGQAGRPGIAVGRYVTTDFENVALVPEAFNEAAPAPALWLDPRFLQIDDPVSIALSGATPEKNWKVVRRDGQWEFDESASGMSPDQATIHGITNAWSFPDFEDVQSEVSDFEGMDTAIIKSANGMVYTLEIGAGDEITRPVRVSASLKSDPDSLGDSTENGGIPAATQTDLESVQAFQDTVFLVSMPLINTLVRDRSTLLPRDR